MASRHEISVLIKRTEVVHTKELKESVV